MIATCICGQTFITKPCLVAAGKGKFCSKKCAYANKTRRSGLKYNITKENKGWYKKGSLPHCTGKHLSDAHKEAIRQTSKGQRRSPNTEFTSERLAGEKNPNWRGGVTPENIKIRNTPEYRAWRKAVFVRDNYTCQECKTRGGKLNADHIKPFSQFPALRLELSNGRTLCKKCHIETDTYGAKLLHGK